MTQQINKRIIAFTGPDGIGKTTQAKLLVDWINSQDFRNKHNYYNFDYIKELNDSSYIFEAFRDLVYALYKEVNTLHLANLIKLNRYILQSELTHQLDECFDKFAVVDRWNICTYCYVKANSYKEELCLPYLTDEHTLIPGLTIMLVGMNGATRMSNREDNNNMFEDIGNEFNVKLAQTYIDFDTSLYAGKVVKINNDKLTKEETHELIKEAVLDYFRGKL